MVVQHWNSLPGEMVESLSQEGFKTHVGVAWVHELVMDLAVLAVLGLFRALDASIRNVLWLPEGPCYG